MSFIAPLLFVVAITTLTILLVVGLVSVPWPVLLLLLGVGLLLTQRVIQRCELENRQGQWNG